MTRVHWLSWAQSENPHRADWRLDLDRTCGWIVGSTNPATDGCAPSLPVSTALCTLAAIQLGRVHAFTTTVARLLWGLVVPALTIEKLKVRAAQPQVRRQLRAHRSGVQQLELLLEETQSTQAAAAAASEAVPGTAVTYEADPVHANADTPQSARPSNTIDPTSLPRTTTEVHEPKKPCLCDVVGGWVHPVDARRSHNWGCSKGLRSR
jgi:hypothetical protein